MMRQATYRTESEQFMRDFYKEVSEKKVVARGARYRKGGSKSRKCSMSTDYMTQKQWKERNGPIMSYSMTQPIDWNSFKKMPADVQEMYVKSMKEKFGANQTDLAEMFDVHPQTVRMVFKSLGLGKMFSRGGKLMNEEQKKVWHKFIGQEAEENAEEQVEAVVEETVDVIEEQPVICEQTEEDDSDVCESDVEDTDACLMSDFAVRFTGKIDVNMVANSLRTILGDHSVGSLKIIYTADSAE